MPPRRASSASRRGWSGAVRSTAARPGSRRRPGVPRRWRGPRAAGSGRPRASSRSPARRAGRRRPPRGTRPAGLRRHQRQAARPAPTRRAVIGRSSRKRRRSSASAAGRRVARAPGPRSIALWTIVSRSRGTRRVDRPRPRRLGTWSPGRSGAPGPTSSKAGRSVSSSYRVRPRRVDVAPRRRDCPSNRSGAM